MMGPIDIAQCRPAAACDYRSHA